MYKHVSSYLPLQVFLEVFPEMQPELSEDGGKPEGYEEISGTKRWKKCLCVSGNLVTYGTEYFKF